MNKSLPLKSGCLNQSFIFSINGFKGRIYTPGLCIGFKDDEMNFNKTLEEPSCEYMFRDPIHWGYIVSWPNGNSRISCLKLEIDIPSKINIDDIKENLLSKTNSWIARFEVNVFAKHLLFGRFNIQVENEDPTNYAYYHLNQASQTYQKLTSDTIRSVSINIHDNFLNPSELKLIVDNTSRNLESKLEYQLLCESQSALYNGDYRKSILNGATALEVCLTRVLKLNLQINDKKLLLKFLNMNNSISKKREILSEFTPLKMPLEKYQVDVEKIRNSVIHAGFEPNKIQAEKAYNIVARAINQLINGL
ncbi:MAG: hypothetical protein GXO85_02180 [Chlorobi bacterium]|nr:hypothetical protein [Chlorobiota bacterium]